MTKIQNLGLMDKIVGKNFYNACYYLALLHLKIMNKKLFLLWVKNHPKIWSSNHKAKIQMLHL